MLSQKKEAYIFINLENASNRMPKKIWDSLIRKATDVTIKNNNTQITGTMLQLNMQIQKNLTRNLV